MSRRAAISLLAACLALALVPSAEAADVDRLYDEYRSSGLIRPCAHSDAELRDGLAEIPADVRAYDPGFADAVNAALEQRASCGTAPASPASPEGARLAADGSPGPAAAAPSPVPAPAEGDDGSNGLAHAGLLAVAALAGAVAVWLAAARKPGDPSD